MISKYHDEREKYKRLEINLLQSTINIIQMYLLMNKKHILKFVAQRLHC